MTSFKIADSAICWSQTDNKITNHHRLATDTITLSKKALADYWCLALTSDSKYGCLTDSGSLKGHPALLWGQAFESEAVGLSRAAHLVDVVGVEDPVVEEPLHTWHLVVQLTRECCVGVLLYLHMLQVFYDLKSAHCRSAVYTIC